MKKRKKGIIIGIFVCVVLLSISALAAATGKTVEIFYNNIKISLDGKEATPVDANGNVVEPFIMDGTTYLPLRAVANMVGLYVDWDPKTNTAILSTTEIVKSVGIVDAINYEKDVIPAGVAKEIGWDAGGMKHTVKLPKIASDTANAVKFNQKIYNEFSKIVDTLKSNKEDTILHRIDYSYKLYNGLAGIIIKQSIGAQMGGATDMYFAYYYDLNNDKELTFAEYLSAHSVNINDLQKVLKEMPYYEYEAQNGYIKINNCILDDKSTVIYYESADSMSGFSWHEAKAMF